MNSEEKLQAAICQAVIILNNGEEIAPQVSHILRSALAEWDPPSTTSPAATTAAAAMAHPAPVPEKVKPCPLPPQGWWCSREIDHPGPCAARRIYALEWAVGSQGRTISSSESEHDVQLMVSGDFATNGDRYTCANELARKLNTPDLHEMRICETHFVGLRANMPYIFTVDPNCEKCVELASKYDDSPPPPTYLKG